MAKNISHLPQPIPQVMVSSTFVDLKDHRAAIIQAIHKHKLHANVMEHDDAKLSHDVIESSLHMVRDSAAYILVISLKYGQTPQCPDRNPSQLSITELEFNEAQRLKRPVLLFIMGDDHPVKKSDIERDATKEKKLDEFRERAKKWAPDPSVDRVYAVFNSLEEFKEKMAAPLAELTHLLKPSASDAIPPITDTPAIPSPPALYAEPDYIGSHRFVGRESQLQELDDWAKPADPTNLMLFEAIGGSGKSMLTWEWATNPDHAEQVRADWAGRFWYSFYERGALMSDFCQRALAYMTGQPLDELRKKKTTELRSLLLAQLHAKPWLLILDGLERVLVAYHRIDAAEVPDEEANRPTDKIAHRNPCDAIRDEDGELLRSLAAAGPSKIIVSSRLTPRVLLNPSSQPIPGTKRIILPGLRPRDAEQLMRSCGIEGDSAAMQSYLATNCDNHPLVIGILAGLIHSYLPARGNFDLWAADPDGGAKLNLGGLDLIQRRNHILEASLEALLPASRQLLSTLALLPGPADYETLSAFNPHSPPEPETAAKPKPPWRGEARSRERWNRMSDERKAEARENYEGALTRRKEYERAVDARLASPEFREAPAKLMATVSDLEQRGLLQYDHRTRRHDLHPVVRSVAVGRIRAEARQQYGQRVLDFFSAQSHDPYEQADSLDDVSAGMNIVRTLLRMERYGEAYSAFIGGLYTSLQYRLEAYAEILSLIKPFLPDGWGRLSIHLSRPNASRLAVLSNHCLRAMGQLDEAIEAGSATISSAVEDEDYSTVVDVLVSIASTCSIQGRLCKEQQCRLLALDLADPKRKQAIELGLRYQLAKMGRLKDPSGLVVAGRSRNLRVLAQRHHAFYLFWNGILSEKELSKAEHLAEQLANRHTMRDLLRLRALWELEKNQWDLAAASFAQAVRMTRERGIIDVGSETGLALAKYHQGELPEPQREAERLAQIGQPASRLLALLFVALNDHEQAKRHALAAYRWAWADGEPYVNSYELAKTVDLLQQMEIPIPDLSPYDPAEYEPFSWEGDVRAAIQQMASKKEG